MSSVPWAVPFWGLGARFDAVVDDDLAHAKQVTALIGHPFGFIDSQQVNDFRVEVLRAGVTNHMLVNIGFQSNQETALHQGGSLVVGKALRHQEIDTLLALVDALSKVVRREDGLGGNDVEMGHENKS